MQGRVLRQLRDDIQSFRRCADLQEEFPAGIFVQCHGGGCRITVRKPGCVQKADKPHRVHVIFHTAVSIVDQKTQLFQPRRPVIRIIDERVQVRAAEFLPHPCIRIIPVKQGRDVLMPFPQHFRRVRLTDLLHPFPAVSTRQAGSFPHGLIFHKIVHNPGGNLIDHLCFHQRTILRFRQALHVR